MKESREQRPQTKLVYGRLKQIQMGEIFVYRHGIKDYLLLEITQVSRVVVTWVAQNNNQHNVNNGNQSNNRSNQASHFVETSKE
jgi:transposase